MTQKSERMKGRVIMSEQVHKTLLACDGLNRTGQEAPASRDGERERGKTFPVDSSKLREYNGDGKEGRTELNEKECQRWEDGKTYDLDIHTEIRPSDAVKYEYDIEIKSVYRELNPKHRMELINLVRFLSASSDEQQKARYLNQLLKEI